MFGNGEGVPQDYAEAARWYRRAAEQGIASAQFNLGLVLNNGEGVAQADADEACGTRLAADQV
ncbi:MAG: sel1 repeat family protein, partial [Alphaproteobacteria bacterium]|nr:sel1 repeat family protein [Alphaproteobacteria bacterium]